MSTRKEVESIFKALGNLRRLEMLLFISGAKERNVGAIARKMKLSLDATSRHLMIMYRANLIERDQRSLEVYYSLNAANQSLKVLFPLIANLRN